MDWEAVAMECRAEALRYKQEAEEAKAELKEFVASSRLLEIELDKELTETKLSLSKRDKEVATLRRERERFQDEVERLRAEKCAMDSKLNCELQSLRAEKEKLQSTVHKLEQKNDDLERELRITCETLRDTKKRLNEELEMRALLSTELDIKEELQDRCRRLEEEMRDLKHVGQLASRQPGAASAISSASTSNNHIPSPVSQGRRSTDAVSQSVKLVRNGFTSPEKYEKCSQDAVEKKSPTNANPKSIGPLVNALPPPLASNVSSVLGDLLGTIQALEEKLLLLHPERKAAACDNGFGPNRRS